MQTLKRLSLAVVSTVILLGGMFSLGVVQTQQAETQVPVPWKLTQSTYDTSVLSNNDYYVNSDGNYVHSPAYTLDGSIPPDATAECQDGYFSFSQTDSGTCSDHGGVYAWLNYPSG
jgi:uncharacterized protein DUF3761